MVHVSSVAHTTHKFSQKLVTSQARIRCQIQSIHLLATKSINIKPVDSDDGETTSFCDKSGIHDSLPAALVTTSGLYGLIQIRSQKIGDISCMIVWWKLQNRNGSSYLALPILDFHMVCPTSSTLKAGEELGDDRMSGVLFHLHVGHKSFSNGRNVIHPWLDVWLSPRPIPGLYEKLDGKRSLAWHGRQNLVQDQRRIVRSMDSSKAEVWIYQVLPQVDSVEAHNDADHATDVSIVDKTTTLHITDVKHTRIRLGLRSIRYCIHSIRVNICNISVK